MAQGAQNVCRPLARFRMRLGIIIRIYSYAFEYGMRITHIEFEWLAHRVRVHKHSQIRSSRFNVHVARQSRAQNINPHHEPARKKQNQLSLARENNKLIHSAHGRLNDLIEQKHMFPVSAFVILCASGWGNCPLRCNAMITAKT